MSFIILTMIATTIIITIMVTIYTHGVREAFTIQEIIKHSFERQTRIAKVPEGRNTPREKKEFVRRLRVWGGGERPSAISGS